MSDLVSQGLGILEKIAPTVASMLGGPFAGQAVSGLEQVLGLAPTGDKDAALAAVATATPDQLLAIKKEENRHSEALAELGVKQEELNASDRDSARKREAAVKDWMPTILGLGVVACFAVLSYLVLTDQAPALHDEDTRLTVGTIFGIIASEVKAVLSYYFGSSVGSKTKDATISSLSK